MHKADRKAQRSGRTERVLLGWVQRGVGKDVAKHGHHVPARIGILRKLNEEQAVARRVGDDGVEKLVSGAGQKGLLVGVGAQRKDCTGGDGGGHHGVVVDKDLTILL